MPYKKRKYYIIIGSKAFFDAKLMEFSNNEEFDYFLDLVKISDDSKSNNYIDVKRANKLIIKNNHYNGIVENAHDRLGALIEELTYDDSEIYIHNPPRVLKKYLEDKKERSLIEMISIEEEYIITNDSESFSDKIKTISDSIIGQDNAIKEISKSLWYLTTCPRKKPYVIMLYGNSSLGKTELVREVSKEFFDGKYLEKHLSMFKNENYSYYFFGDLPNRRSIGFDLLERESNLVFFDEFDKCPEYFLSAFYTLFDNNIFKDTTYDVNTSGIVIILTANYNTVEEMKKQLGLPIFYRIDKFIHFNDFDHNTIYSIVRKEIKSREHEYKDKLDEEEIYSSVSQIILTEGENARTIKYKIQKVIEELLFKEIEDNL